MFKYISLLFAKLFVGIQQLNSQRVLRGGSWINNARNLRSANRNANQPGDRNHNIGLRLAGALLNAIDQKRCPGGGSINQLYFPSGFYQLYRSQQNQDPLCVSRQNAESLQSGRLLSCFWCSNEH